MAQRAEGSETDGTEAAGRAIRIVLGLAAATAFGLFFVAVGMAWAVSK